MNYSALGFNTMIYQDPCCGSQIPANTVVDMNASVDSALPDSSAATTTKKSSWPWWIVIAAGYLYYKEQQGV